MNGDEPKRGPGRPRKYPVEGKRQNVTFRVREETRERLATAAEASGRSMSEEIERRVEQTFEEQDRLGGAETSLVARLVSDAIQAIELACKAKWYEDAAVAAMCRTASIEIINAVMEKPIPALQQLLGLQTTDDLKSAEQMGRELARHILRTTASSSKGTGTQKAGGLDGLGGFDPSQGGNP